MRTVIFVLLCLVLLWAKKSNNSKTNWQLEASGTLFLDGNMAKNQSEQFGWYFLPQLGSEFSFTKLPLIIFLDLAYDGYLSERDIDDLTPFMDAGLSVVLGSKHFKNKIIVRNRLYAGSDLYIFGESETSYLTIGLHSFSLESHSGWSAKRLYLSLTLDGTYSNFGMKAEGSRSDETSIDVKISPQIVYHLNKSEKKVKLKSLAIEGQWRERIAVNPNENQRKQELAMEVKGNAWQSQWQITFGGSYKSFAKKYDNEFTSQLDDLTWNELFVETKLTQPLTSRFSVGLTGEFCQRSGTISRHDFWDNRAGMVLRWKIKKD